MNLYLWLKAVDLAGRGIWAAGRALADKRGPVVEAFALVLAAVIGLTWGLGVRPW